MSQHIRAMAQVAGLRRMLASNQASLGNWFAMKPVGSNPRRCFSTESSEPGQNAPYDVRYLILASARLEMWQSLCGYIHMNRDTTPMMAFREILPEFVHHATHVCCIDTTTDKDHEENTPTLCIMIGVMFHEPVFTVGINSGCSLRG
jgi:hypothetical protein